MTRFISPLGFSGHRVTRPIIAHGLTTGDEVILLQPEQKTEAAAGRGKQALRDVESTLTGTVHSLELTQETLPADDFETAVDICQQALIRDRPPVVCLGAGATDVWLPLVTATFAEMEAVADVMVYSDVENTAMKQSLPDLTVQIPGRVRETFATIRRATDTNESVSMEAICEVSNDSRSTISRHISTLEELGLVTAKRQQRRKHVRLTLAGRLASRDE